MGLFDRFKRASSAPAMVVPDGHELTIFGATAEPGVIRTRGGVVVANLGVSSDEPDEELERILEAVLAAVREPSAPARLVNVNRELPISDLFAPSNPEVLTFRSPVSWVLHREAVNQVMARPERLQRFLRCMHRVRQLDGESVIEQAAYIVDPPSPRTTAFARLVSGIGLEVKSPDASNGDLTIHVEVARPEGVVLCALAGQTYTGEAPDTYARKVNVEKDGASGDALAAIEEAERSALAERAGPPDERALALRAPRLRRVILDLHAANAEMGPLFAELRGRVAPLWLMRSVENGSMEVRTFGAAGRALPIFADLQTLEWAARDLNKMPGTFTVGCMPCRALVDMAAGGDMGLAICAFRDRATPVYAILPPAMVKTLAS